MTRTWTVIFSEPNLVLKSVRVTGGEQILPLLMAKDTMLRLPYSTAGQTLPEALWGEHLQQTGRDGNRERGAGWDALPSCSWTTSFGGGRDELQQVGRSTNCYYCGKAAGRSCINTMEKRKRYKPVPELHGWRVMLSLAYDYWRGFCAPQCSTLRICTFIKRFPDFKGIN